MPVLSTIRLVLWGATIVFACITVGIASNFVAIQSQASVNISTFAALTLAVSALTLLTLPVFIGIDQARTGAFTSMIIVEMVVLTILWILWVVAAGLTTSAYNSSVCAFYGSSDSICQQFTTIQAFSFMAFFAVLGYAFILLVFTLIAHNRGHTGVWLQSVKETNFFAPPVNAPEDPSGEKAQNAPQMPAPQMQYQYPPNFGTPPPQGMPMQGVPMQGMPMQGMPMQGMPMQGMPMQGMPMQGSPLGVPGQLDQPIYPQNTGGTPIPQQNTGLVAQV